MIVPIKDPVKSWLIETNHVPETFCLCSANGIISYEHNSSIYFVSAKTGIHFPDALHFEIEISAYGWSENGERFYVANKNIWQCFNKNGDTFERAENSYFIEPKHGSIMHIYESENGEIYLFTEIGHFFILDARGKIIFEHQFENAISNFICSEDVTTIFVNLVHHGEFRIYRFRKNTDDAWNLKETIFPCAMNMAGMISQKKLIGYSSSFISFDESGEDPKIFQPANDAHVRDVVIIDDETIFVLTDDPCYMLLMQIPDGKILFEMDGMNDNVTLVGFFGDNQYLVMDKPSRIPFDSYTERELYMQVFDFGSPNLGRGDSSVFNPLPV